MTIFRWGRETLKKFGPVEKTSCNNCNNELGLHLQKVTSWITLFSIPIIPYGMKYLLACSVCGRSLELEKEEFKKLKNLANKKDNLVSELDIIRTDSMVMNTGRIIRTETQINFIRQMKELKSNKKD
jgi:transcription elongation factor Elf1